MIKLSQKSISKIGFLIFVFSILGGNQSYGQSGIPTNLNATNETANGFTLNWTAPTGYTIQGYNLYKDGGYVAWVNGSSLSYNFTGITQGISHDYVVKAIQDGSFVEHASATFNFVLGSGGDTQAPTAPTLSSSNITENTVDLSWSGATDNVGVTGYKIYRDGTEIANQPGATYQAIGLSASTNYAFTVSAYDAAGNNSALSNTANVTTSAASDTQAPTVPTGLSSSGITSSAFNLSWSASTDNVGVTGYKVYLDGTLNKSVSGTNTSITGLSVSTSYNVTVAATDAAGNESAQSAALAVQTSGASGASDEPTNLNATNATATGFVLNWTAPTNYTPQGYNIYKDNGYVAWANGSATAYTINGISQGTSHNYVVKAIDQSFIEHASAPFAYTLGGSATDTQAPTAPTLSSSNVTSSSVDLSWSGATDNVGVTGYKVYQSGTLIASPTGTSYAVSGLSAATSYAFTVKAIDAAGNESVSSNTANVTTNAAGGGPSIINHNNALLAYIGRIDQRNSQFTKVAWPGAGVRMKFQGSTLKAKINCVANNGNNYAKVVIDGVPQPKLVLSAGTSVYTLASGLNSNQSHTAEIYKITDGFDGYIAFEEFELQSGKTLETYTKPQYKIEYYGDSQTVGYAIDDFARTNGADDGGPAYKNNYYSYSGLASRALNAEYHVIARSGIALKSDPWGGVPMTSTYTRVLDSDASFAWDFSQWTPDLIVINLGQNDYWNAAANGDITQNYIDFVNNVRAKYTNGSQIPVVLSLGDMDAAANTDYQNYVTNAANTLGTNTYSLIFPHTPGNVNTPGSMGHPSRARAQTMSDLLIGLVQSNNLLGSTPPTNQILHEVVSNWDDVTPTWANGGCSYEVIANPVVNSDNNSASCAKVITNGSAYPYLKLSASQFFDFTTKPYFKLKINGVHGRGQIQLKLQKVPHDDNDYYYQAAYSHGNGETGWEELIFDMRGAPSGKYKDLLIMVDANDYNNGVSGQTWYVDELIRFDIAGDTQPPTAPANLAASEVTDNMMVVSWDKATDNSLVDKYKVYLNNVLHTTTTSNKVLLYDLTASTSYSIKVKSVDVAGNESTNFSSSITQSTTASPGSSPVPDDFNYIFGTQTFGPDYQFTSTDKLTETAQGMAAMGTNILKMTLSPGNYVSPDPGSSSSLNAINSNQFLKDALDMEEFKYVFLWVYSPNVWIRDGITPTEVNNEKDNVYKLTEYLLDRYKGTNKKFFIGQWEADWELVNANSGVEDWNIMNPNVSQARIDGMIQQLNARQRAVDSARTHTVHHDVEVYNYVEVNLPKVRTIDNNLPSIMSHVLPHTNVDFVSYSCYDATKQYNTEADVKTSLFEVLNALENALPAKAGLPFEKRVFIGEFGYPNGREKKDNPAANDYYKEPLNQEQQDAWSRNVMKAALEWGAPFALYWTFYGNEHKAGWNTQNGFWMVDNLNRKQKIYHTYKNYYAAAKQGIIDFKNANGGALPTEAQFRTIALTALNGASNTASKNVKKEERLEVNEKNEVGDIVVYPNPATDRIYITNHNLEIKTLRVYNLSGREIMRLNGANEGVINLELSNVSKGLYFIKISTVKGVERTFKFVKK
ncbi:fibronectin type III domain-containing protein [Seonamhaeicola sp.]|uniref:fibronectin type III domain-containing protein n=1 Tax=Seonamhaeicola sp. TaxID=1912245 RepID=UPI0026291609|nr:fibronectin type III domain-containing protein [Seonamhaeicola sp.]